MTLAKRIARARRAFLGRAPSRTAPVPIRNHPDYAYLTPDLAMVRLANGHLLYVDPQDETMSAHLIGYGYWEPNVYGVVERLLSPGDRVVEVGANLGYYTVAMARLVGPTGRVTAFEANPRIAGLLGRSLYINGVQSWVDLQTAAALDSDAPVRFETSRRRSGWGHVASLTEPAFDDSEVVVAPSRTIDSLGLDRVDLIRIDAEGTEPRILRGAETTLRANAGVVVCMEWNSTGAQSSDALLAWLTGLGFQFWRIEANGALTAQRPEDMLTLADAEVVMSRRRPLGLD